MSVSKAASRADSSSSVSGGGEGLGSGFNATFKPPLGGFFGGGVLSGLAFEEGGGVVFVGVGGTGGGGFAGVTVSCCGVMA